MPLKEQNKLTRYLIDQGKITSKQFKELVEEAEKFGISVDKLIEEKQLFSEKEIVEAKSEIFNLPVVELTGLVVDKELLKIIPRQIAENYRLVAFGRDENIVKVAILDPTDSRGREAVEFLARQRGLVVKYFLALPSALKDILNQYSGLGLELEKVVGAAEAKFAPLIGEEKIWSEIGLEKITEEAPIAKLVASILKYAVDNKASDVHIEPLADKTRVRCRIDGVLRVVATLSGHIHSSIISRVKVMANLKLDETRIPQDGRIRINVSNRRIDLRISTLPLLEQEKVVMRILDPAQKIFTLEDLGFWGYGLEVMKRNLRRPHGMFLVTGPTGCGKTTTLYAVLKILNRPEVNVVTLEDPIEYFMEGVNQSQVKPDIGYSFASGLRSVVRQDPNIIMVGEIRDTETAELATHAALTGHIVLSTLHTNDAFGAIPRLIDMKIEPFLLSSSLNLIIAQRLVRKICQECREETELTPEVEKDLIADLAQAPDFDLNKFKDKKAGRIKIYHGRGCPKCNQEGYKGRTSIFEVLEVTDQMKKIIVSGAHLDEVRAEFVRQKMTLMKQDGLIKVLQGITTIEEVLRAAKE